MSRLTTLMEGLGGLDEETRRGAEFDIQPLPGGDEVFQVIVNGREELPVFVTATDSQILCICYLWGEDEVRPEGKLEMLEAMLDMNIPMPLSSFGRIDDKYAIFGAMALSSDVADLALELVMLSDNAIDAIEALSDHLR